MRAYDIVILGSGPGGYVSALRAATRGAKVCCVEPGLIGGCCLNVGCIPAKAMLYASGVYYTMLQGQSLGFTINEPRVDGDVYMSRVIKVVDGLREGVEYLLKNRKVDVIKGRGRLTGKDRVLVETHEGNEEIQAESIIIATGSRPIRPKFLPWDSDRLMTTDEATRNDHLPQSVLIMGGGVIGCEMATAYAELGIPTTIIEMLEELMMQFDPDVSKVVKKSLEERGVKILTGSKVTKMDADHSIVTAELESARKVQAECALISVGRTANVEDIGLERVGIKVENGIIPVDDHCRTVAENIYAIGDVAEKKQYAHVAARMGIVAADNACGVNQSDDRSVIPEVVYTHPEMGMVGLSEKKAREKYPDLRVGKFPYQVNGMARAYGETKGHVKLFAEPENGVLVGGVVIGAHATDVIQELTLAVRHGLTIEQIAETIHPHPTFGEGIYEAAEAWMGFPIHWIG